MLTRRRFIEITAAAAATVPLRGALAKGSRPLTRWTGIAMGAHTSITLAQDNEAEAQRIIAAARAEIERIETIFSLYRSDSAISRLNRRGYIDQPPLDMLELLSLSGGVHAATGGAFDPTVQPLWRAYAEHYARSDADPAGPDPAILAEARQATGWRHVAFNAAGVSFEKPGMALTLNGIAQGYATDRVADLLRAEGLEDVLVDVGEIRALGHHPDGRPWRAGLAVRGDEVIEERIDIVDTALATSAPLGTVFDAAGHVPHLIDPRTGIPGGLWRRVSVLGASAAVADGLSTAFALMPADVIGESLRRYPGYRVIAIDEASVRIDLSV